MVPLAVRDTQQRATGRGGGWCQVGRQRLARAASPAASPCTVSRPSAAGTARARDALMSCCTPTRDNISATPTEQFSYLREDNSSLLFGCEDN
eukprot:379081-Prymnesium_polylepis.1